MADIVLVTGGSGFIGSHLPGCFLREATRSSILISLAAGARWHG